MADYAESDEFILTKIAKKRLIFISRLIGHNLLIIADNSVYLQDETNK
jgi:hypothetical protein